jgi:anti-anti-sigma regulatory factor
MDDTGRHLLGDVLERHRDEIVDRSTDWVFDQAVDLGARRPREETQRIVARMVASQAAALLDGDPAPLDAFVEFVTSHRAGSEFHVSTLLRGMLCFRRGLEPVLLREVGDGRVAYDVLAAVDELAHASMFRAADLYTAKLNRTILQRRAELEEELAHVMAARERELDDKIRTIDEQRRILNTLTSPVIQVWEGVLVVPLIGELSGDRAAAVQERVLAAVVETRAHAVIVDVTGLTVTDEQLASEVLRLVRSVRLIGSDAALVGLSPVGAMALASLDVSLDEVHAFGTLHDGLLAALARGGYRVSRRR